MKKQKEDRSHWVAVAPISDERSDDLPKVTPASSAYQFFQRENSHRIKEQLRSSGEASDVGNLGKATSRAWQTLDGEERERYERLASEDKFRFLRESHLRDVAVMERKERLRRERTEIIVTEGEGRSTRGKRQREMRKKERKDKRERRTSKGSKGTKGNKNKSLPKKKQIKQILHSDEEEYQSNSCDESDESEYGNSSDSKSDTNGDSDSANHTDSHSDSDDSSTFRNKRKKKKARSPPVISAAVLAKREKAKQDKEQKETYIASRQQHLRNERAKQAKKRLDFLLKQSDIFRHFGQVKEDSAKFFSSRNTQNAQNTSNTSNTQSAESAENIINTQSSESAENTQNTQNDPHQPSTATNRRDKTGTETAMGEMDPDELEQADEHTATFLTSQPSTLGHGQMRAYQLEGLNWMIRLQENGVNGILADEMGLGKTLQSISILVYMMEYSQSNGPHLIVVPKSTLSNWMNELNRWAPKLTAVRFHGNKDERETIAKTVLQPGQRDEHRTWNVCVTTYEVCNMDKQILNKFAWTYLIIDEAHRLKNEASAFSQTIRTFETRYRLLLTGTPLQNNLHELWALLNFLVPDVFASAEQFDDWFNLDIDDADEKNKLISQLHKILRPFMLRRLKVDVETSLPPKHETILFTGMSAMQKKLYKDILMRDIEVLQGGSTGGGGGGGNRTAILNIVMQLRKCAGHPYLFPGVEDRSLPPLGEHLVENCGKMVLLDKLLNRLQELGHRVLLFTQMTRILDILEDYMVMRKFQYCRIDGNTDYEKREASIDAFNAPNSEKFLFLLSTRAGGLGINLQTADVVILYDSDWNPQADLQAQDRAHRIGQKKKVQVFRLVTEHTIEEKVVERAQQKLKLDAMVVQQGRLKEKDKLSREELLEAVRFGADKVFKTKDSSITDDDIDLILESGKKKTQELNEKLKAADKGDMLDFKLDGGGMSAQTYEGVDYSKQDTIAQVKAAQAQAELLGILDMGKRERRTVANYNEDQLYRQQIASQQGNARKRKKKDIKLPKFLRLPRLDEWQMFDRDALNALQEEEETAFRALPEEMQNVAKGKLLADNKEKINNESNETSHNDSLEGEGEGDVKPNTSNNDDDSISKEEQKPPLTIADLPPLLTEEQQSEKDRLMAEGFADWGRSHYTAFIKASAKYGRNNFLKIALEVGKPQIAIEDYAAAFWDDNMGKKRFSENEYDRAVKTIERGEKKLKEIKGLERGTRVLLSLFDNPWRELEFMFVNCKDKLFTPEEDRHLLCWAHKYGYGQWGAIKMAIRRSPDFRFDYYLRSLPIDALGRRCEQLMKAAEKEVEQMEKKAREDAGLSASDENGQADTNDTEHCTELPPIKLPRFKEVKAMKRKQEMEEATNERQQLEGKVLEVENQIEEIQKRLKFLQECSKEMDGTNRHQSNSSEFPDDLLPELANLVAKSGPAGTMTIVNEFCTEHGQVSSKKMIASKIEDIAKKEKRAEEGDTRAVWHLLPEFMNLLTVETIRYLRKAKEERLEKKRGGSRKKTESEEEGESTYHKNKEAGAIGPDGDFVPFPHYDCAEEPRENKKAFTLFCNGTRKEVKASLDSVSRKDKSKVNSILKEKWFALSRDDKSVWKKWEAWDAERYKRDLKLFEDAKRSKRSLSNNAVTGKSKRDTGIAEKIPMSDQGLSVPKKKRDFQLSPDGRGRDSANSETSSRPVFHIPKKKRNAIHG